MINITNLVFSYPTKSELFSGINLKIPAGRICGLLGKNGVGKTTLLRIFSGLLFPKGGRCLVEDFDPAKRTPSFLREIYFLPEEFYLPQLTIEQYFKSYAGFYPRFNKDLFLTYLREFDLSLNENLQELSYGQKKKALLAFALATDCKLLMLDEPSNGLDIPSKSQLRKLLASALTAERTIILSTHQVRDLQNLIDTILILDNGRIVFQQPVEEIARCISFGEERDISNTEALYTEKVFGGYKTILANKSEFESQIDLEILFNAVLEKADKINALFM